MDTNAMAGSIAGIGKSPVAGKGGWAQAGADDAAHTRRETPGKPGL